MNHLHVRCPSCAKLYQIDVATIFSTSPHFKCLGCPATFTFDFPPASVDDIKTRPVFAEGAGPEIATRKCPKCGAASPKTAEECYSCHVIFEKLEGLPLDSGVRAQPSLVRRWKELLNDYADLEKHQDFLMACRDLDALDFAESKYEHIRRMQGTDEIADQMLERLSALKAMVPPPVSAAAKADADAVGFEAVPGADERARLFFFTSAQWRQIAFFSPFALSAILILWGFTHAGQRNTVGTGIAIAVLSYGLMYGIRVRTR